MAVCKVTLLGAATWTARGRKFKRHEFKIVTSRSDLDYFKRTPAFSVEELGADAIKKVKKAQVADVDEVGEDADERKKPDLKAMTKAELVKHADEEYGLDLDIDDRKDDLIKAIKSAKK